MGIIVSGIVDVLGNTFIPGFHQRTAWTIAKLVFTITTLISVLVCTALGWLLFTGYTFEVPEGQIGLRTSTCGSWYEECYYNLEPGLYYRHSFFEEIPLTKKHISQTGWTDFEVICPDGETTGQLTLEHIKFEVTNDTEAEFWDYTPEKQFKVASQTLSWTLNSYIELHDMASFSDFVTRDSMAEIKTMFDNSHQAMGLSLVLNTASPAGGGRANGTFFRGLSDCFPLQHPIEPPP